ncbi:hypothetical protein GLOTRDRAFT_134544 [Gloeophyllum trabeum ATCC 11539]|uniref:Uncharacterized protein n=1 Tax=Gloeophyllum trabeum (strain ATCC 11539 / FP-39264 / Madison 617) TaxID=670483 RepID=S7PR27_GLOTA|nr:uncharacterized protein GLOTRDRAFT_134544 [Gloeophyllum trabeum ATCC 11539]EPQ49842.1 hypothetical protein GLOTRDRAFT_134544 [Gloeophyllum trabeum ATCC 11539]
MALRLRLTVDFNKDIVPKFFWFLLSLRSKALVTAEDALVLDRNIIFSQVPKKNKDSSLTPLITNLAKHIQKPTEVARPPSVSDLALRFATGTMWGRSFDDPSKKVSLDLAECRSVAYFAIARADIVEKYRPRLLKAHPILRYLRRQIRDFIRREANSPDWDFIDGYRDVDVPDDFDPAPSKTAADMDTRLASTQFIEKNFNALYKSIVGNPLLANIIIAGNEPVGARQPMPTQIAEMTKAFLDHVLYSASYLSKLTTPGTRPEWPIQWDHDTQSTIRLRFPPDLHPFPADLVIADASSQDASPSTSAPAASSSTTRQRRATRATAAADSAGAQGKRPAARPAGRMASTVSAKGKGKEKEKEVIPEEEEDSDRPVTPDFVTNPPPPRRSPPQLPPSPSPVTEQSGKRPRGNTSSSVGSNPATKLSPRAAKRFRENTSINISDDDDDDNDGLVRPGSLLTFVPGSSQTLPPDSSLPSTQPAAMSQGQLTQHLGGYGEDESAHNDNAENADDREDGEIVDDGEVGEDGEDGDEDGDGDDDNDDDGDGDGEVDPLAMDVLEKSEGVQLDG